MDRSSTTHRLLLAKYPEYGALDPEAQLEFFFSLPDEEMEAIRADSMRERGVGAHRFLLNSKALAKHNAELLPSTAFVELEALCGLDSAGFLRRKLRVGLGEEEGRGVAPELSADSLQPALNASQRLLCFPVRGIPAVLFPAEDLAAYCEPLVQNVAGLFLDTAERYLPLEMARRFPLDRDVTEEVVESGEIGEGEGSVSGAAEPPSASLTASPHSARSAHSESSASPARPLDAPIIARESYQGEKQTRVVVTLRPKLQRVAELPESHEAVRTKFLAFRDAVTDYLRHHAVVDIERLLSSRPAGWESGAVFLPEGVDVPWAEGGCEHQDDRMSLGSGRLLFWDRQSAAEISLDLREEGVWGSTAVALESLQRILASWYSVLKEKLDTLGSRHLGPLATGW